MDLQNKLRSLVRARFAYLECHCSLFRTVRSKICRVVLLLYLVVSSALERYLLVAARVIKELKLHLAAAINFIDLVSLTTMRSFPLFVNLVARSTACTASTEASAPAVL